MRHGPTPKVIEKNISPALFDSHVFVQDNSMPIIKYKVSTQRVRVTKKAKQKNQALQQVDHCVRRQSCYIFYRARVKAFLLYENQDLEN